MQRLRRALQMQRHQGLPQQQPTVYEWLCQRQTTKRYPPKAHRHSPNRRRNGATQPRRHDGSTWFHGRARVHAHDRDAAIARMLRALDEFEIAGVTTLVDFHRALVGSEEFARAGSCRGIVDDPSTAMEAVSDAPGTVVGAPAGRSLEARNLVVEVDGRRFDVAVHDPATGLPLAPPVRPRSAGGAGGDGTVTLH